MTDSTADFTIDVIGFTGLPKATAIVAIKNGTALENANPNNALFLGSGTAGLIVNRKPGTELDVNVQLVGEQGQQLNATNIYIPAYSNWKRDVAIESIPKTKPTDGSKLSYMNCGWGSGVDKNGEVASLVTDTSLPKNISQTFISSSAVWNYYRLEGLFNKRPCSDGTAGYMCWDERSATRVAGHVICSPQSSGHESYIGGFPSVQLKTVTYTNDTANVLPTEAAQHLKDFEAAKIVRLEQWAKDNKYGEFKPRK